MNLEIIDTNLTMTVHGFSGIAVNKDYAGTAFKLMDRMWKIVKSNNLENKGINVWVYEQNETVFAGVELTSEPAEEFGLEHKQLSLTKYAVYKHIGPYHQIKHVVQNMMTEIKERGFEPGLPYIEIYGHWSNDESKLETTMIMSLG